MTRSKTVVFSAAPNRHYFGCELSSILNLSVLDKTEQNHYAECFQHRMVSFVTSLINYGDERFTFDLRMISQPDSTNYRSGRLRLAILGRVTDMNRADAQHYAASS